MNFLLANTTNHRRAVMLVAAAVLGAIIVLVLYPGPFAIRVPIESGVMGLLVFEAMFRTRKWLNLKTLILYVVLATIISQFLYGILYGGFSFQGLSGVFSVFPYNLYALLEMSVVTGLAYYLIKIYRNEAWAIPESTVDASNEPVYENQSLPADGWLQKYSQQIMGFIGWYLIATVLSSGAMFGLITTPVTLIALIVFARSKQSKGVASGILIAIALNFVVSLVKGVSMNGWCLIPFYNSLN